MVNKNAIQTDFNREYSMNLNNHLVSVIMPCFNSAAYIERAVYSVLNQSYSNWELIIIDDGSTDTTIEKVAELQLEALSNIKLIMNVRNLGADQARNIGIKKAKGKFIAFLDADDQWDPEKLTVQIGFMIKKDLPFTFTGYYVNRKGNSRKVSVPYKLVRNDLLKNNQICTSTVIFDQEKLGRILMPLIKKGQDLALWLQIIRVTDYAIGLNETFTTYNKMHGSLSANKLDSAKWVWRLYRDTEKIGILASIYFFIHYAINGLVKHLR